MSVANLYNDIREFLSATGLPENHVPTLKELSHYGRKRVGELGRNSESKLAFSHRRWKERVISSSDGEISNGSVPSSVQQIEDRELENSNFRRNYISTKEQRIDGGKNLSDETVENQAEIRRLKFFLHQNELELTQLKEQIENEKQVFSLLQTKVETEISKAQNLISQKDSELHAAEETLSGLKEVEIEYSGDGATVELAGSFNGWGHKITMDLQPSSSVTDPNGSRTSRLWQAVLWLYPGVYEIKFIIDGRWTIDPLRESISWNGFENNIIRVDG
ncbi:hypothetical protein OROMI_012165 [Orobanche minor]